MLHMKHTMLLQSGYSFDGLGSLDRRKLFPLHELHSAVKLQRQEVRHPRKVVVAAFGILHHLVGASNRPKPFRDIDTFDIAELQ
jgi:hypothetical protein